MHGRAGADLYNWNSKGLALQSVRAGLIQGALGNAHGPSSDLRVGISLRKAETEAYRRTGAVKGTHGNAETASNLTQNVLRTQLAIQFPRITYTEKGQTRLN